MNVFFLNICKLFINTIEFFLISLISLTCRFILLHNVNNDYKIK